MNKATAAILASLALFVGAPSASAGVIVLATLTPDSISVGGTVDFDLALTLVPDLGYSGATFKGGNVTLFSGDGQSTTFSIPPPGGTTRDFTWQVTYLIPGNYTPSYTGNATYTETFSVCPAHGPCSSQVDQHLSGLFSDPKVGDNLVTVTAVPELPTWGMMLIGFAGMGLVAYRRSKKLSAAVST